MASHEPLTTLFRKTLPWFETSMLHFLFPSFLRMAQCLACLASHASELHPTLAGGAATLPCYQRG